MHVEIERPKLLAARRLGEALRQRQLSLSAAAALKTEEGTSSTGAVMLPPRSETITRTHLLKAAAGNEAGEEPPLGGPPPRTG